MSVASLIKGRRGASGFGYASTAEEVTAGLDLRGKNVLITGATSGLGLESARVLAQRGAKIFVAARTHQKAEDTCRLLPGSAVPLECELSEPASVRSCVAELRASGAPLDVVIANAGIMALPERSVRHGHELQFLTNHIGHFLLVTGLLDQLSASGRVVILSSSAHHGAPPAGIQFDDLSFQHRYRPWTAYSQSKLANLLFARALARRFAGTSRTANAVHPGVIATNLSRHMNVFARVALPVVSAIAFKSVPEGASTQCYVAARPELAGISGEYFQDCNVAKTSRHARNDELSERLWKVSEEIVSRL